jgi:MSHA pilin protein MshC
MFKVRRSRFKRLQAGTWNIELGTRNIEPGTRNPERRTRNLEHGTRNTQRRTRGFTLVELVVTLVIIGLLAAVIGPRFMGSDAFASRGFYDEAQSVVRYAQKTAIAWRNTPVYVCVSSTTVSARTGSCSGALVTHPVAGDLLTTAPSGVTLTPAEFSFDGGGRPNPNAQLTITFASTIAGDPARQIVVEAETGYVRP